MFSAGKKNWVKKFFALVEAQQISLDAEVDRENAANTVRLVCERSGLLYGVPNQNIYAQHLVEHSTRTERLQLLFFEGLLLVHTLHTNDPFDKTVFLEQLSEFFALEVSTNRTWLGKKKAPDINLLVEKEIDNRIRVAASYTQSNFWLNHLTNAYLYLDIVRYFHYCQGLPLEHKNRDAMMGDVLVLWAGIRQKAKESQVHFSGQLFKNLTACAELSEPQRSELEHLTWGSEPFLKAKTSVMEDEMLLLFVFHFVALLHYERDNALAHASEFMYNLGDEFGVSKEMIDEQFWECKATLSQHSESFYNLLSDSETKIISTHLSRKYRRILGRNKDRLVQELKESRELVHLIRESTRRELTAEEKVKVKEQSLDLLKTVPSIGIYLLPGGSLWLPLVLKLIPDLLPSAFKENEVEEKK
jgi:hypothetical protein